MGRALAGHCINEAVEILVALFGRSLGSEIIFRRVERLGHRYAVIPMLLISSEDLKFLDRIAILLLKHISGKMDGHAFR
jgi:hypothetical protein